MFGKFMIILFTVTVTLVDGYADCSDRIQCGEATTAKQALLEGNSTNGLPDCVYTIMPYSLLVCQLKVYFTIVLAQPQPPLVPPVTSPAPMPNCVDAYLQIGPYKFCGRNVGQHVYIPFSASNLANNEIIIHRAASLIDQTFWQLSVTQIECPTDQPLGFNLQNMASDQAQNPINPQNLANFANLGLYNPGNNFGHFSGLTQLRNINARLIAPQGCLQYFTEERGVIQSFNYNDGNGPYLPEMQYAICIRRPPLAEGLRLTFNTFELNSNGPMEMDGDCTESVLPGITQSNDYITVPFSTNPVYSESTRYCGSSLQLSGPPSPMNNVLEVQGDAPFVIYFSSGKYYNDPNSPITTPVKRAFEISYEVLK